MIILASKSPRRKELMEYIGEEFVIESAEVDESYDEKLSPDKIVEYLNKYNSMTGLFPKMINQYIVKSSNNNNESIAYNIKNLTFNVIETIEFKNAQVTSGGINVNELKDSLESKFHDNLYFLGEIIDVDGMCGGYNLHFAFSCANTVAKDINKKVSEDNE